MNSTSHTAHIGARDELIATLRRFETDRRERHENERADDAAKAAAELEGGAPSAYFERVCYEVGQRDRHAVRTGTRAWVQGELQDAVTGFTHLGNPRRAQEAREALLRLSAGDASVRVGHLVYEVTE